MSVEIDPAELGFQRPFTSEVSQTLKIKNPHPSPVAFKVKTTAPKQYCVRPNSGRIEAGKEVEVNVLLQAMKIEPPLDAKCRDKFLVQSVAITPEMEMSNINTIWQHVDETEKSSVQEKKIRVVFLPTKGAGFISTPQKISHDASADNSMHDAAPPAYHRSPSPPEEAFTPQTTSRSTTDTTLKDGTASTSSTVAAAKQTIAKTTEAVAAKLPSREELEAQLAQAQATIAAYTKEGGLRLRKAAGATADAIDTQAIKQQVAQGVPIQIVAGLCLLSFLLAYLFF